MYIKKAILGSLIVVLVTFPMRANAVDPPLKGAFSLARQLRAVAPFLSLSRYTLDLTRNTATRQGSPQEFPIEASRHHIIPQERLRAFFATVVAHPGHLRRLHTAWVNFRTMARSTFGRMAADSLDRRRTATCPAITYAEVAQAMDIADGFASGRVVPGGTIEPEGLDAFSDYFLWAPGNLFEGPSGMNRVDDPAHAPRNDPRYQNENEGFEIYAEYIVGRDRFQYLSRLNRNMYNYIQDPSGNEGLLRQLSADLTHLYRESSTNYRITPLDPDQWERVGVLGGRLYRIRRHTRQKRSASLVEDQIQNPIVTDSSTKCLSRIVPHDISTSVLSMLLLE